jgi:hypothetical protein
MASCHLMEVIKGYVVHSFHTFCLQFAHHLACSLEMYNFGAHHTNCYLFVALQEEAGL